MTKAEFLAQHIVYSGGEVIKGETITEAVAKALEKNEDRYDIYIDCFYDEFYIFEAVRKKRDPLLEWMFG